MSSKNNPDSAISMHLNTYYWSFNYQNS